MNTEHARGAFGSLGEASTLRIQRLLPGPVDRVWRYVTDSEYRRLWLAAGPMDLVEGGAFELIWRNDELTVPPGTRPEGFQEEHRMLGQITECAPPNRLTITWNGSGLVSFDLEAQGEQVLLTITHRELSNDTMRRMVGAGWHVHLDILSAKLSNTVPPAFWDEWLTLRAEYDRRFTAIKA